jgi:hypothetical protein
LAYFLALKMEATCSCETFVNFQWTAQCYVPKERAHNGYLNVHRNLGFYGVRTDISIFTVSYHWTTFCASNIQFKSSHFVFLNYLNIAFLMSPVSTNWSPVV